MEPSPPSEPRSSSGPRSSSVPSSRAPRAPAWWVDVASRSDRGCVRAINEDVALAAPIRAGADVAPEEPFDLDAPLEGVTRSPVLLAVCDGMGGAASGEVASREAAQVIGRRVASGGVASPAGSAALGRAIVDALEHASREVYGLARSELCHAGMGTTATVCAVANGELVIGQVGDSRAYLLRDGELRQLTRDQTLAQLMIERGQLQPSERETFFGAHVILQAVGTQETVDVDLRTLALESGDVLLLCSDGLCNALDDAVLAEVLGGEGPAVIACERLIELAKEAGATDNVTCVVARLRQRAPTPPSQRRPAIAEPLPLPPKTEPEGAGDVTPLDADSGEDSPSTLRAAGLWQRLAGWWKPD